MNVSIFLIIIVVIIVLIILRKHFKRLVLPNVFLITGAVKSGKTLLSVTLAIRQYRKAVRRYYIRKFFSMIFHKEVGEFDKPMLYSNIPLAKCKYNPLTKDIIMRKVRIPNQSVVLIDEASLLADSMLFNNKDINNNLMAFVKLFAHYSHNGTLIIDTQSVADLHFAFKRCMSSYLYIYERIKFPFISVMRVREMLYSEDNSLISTSSEDLALTLRNIFIWNGAYKKYDSCCYSIFTDHLKYQVDYEHRVRMYREDLKCYSLVSFQDFSKKINAEMDTLYVLNDLGEIEYEDEESIE